MRKRQDHRGRERAGCLNRSRRAPAGLVQVEGSQQSLRPVGVDRALQEAGALPTPYATVSAEWTCVLVVQLRLDAHEVKVVRALRKHRHKGARCSVVRRGRRCVACRCVSYLPPYYSRLVARSRGAWCRVIQGLMADAAEVLFRSPRPTRNRVPILDRHLHPQQQQPTHRGTPRRRRAFCARYGRQAKK